MNNKEKDNKTKSLTITVRIAPFLNEKIEAYATEQKRSRNYIINETLSQKFLSI